MQKTGTKKNYSNQHGFLFGMKTMWWRQACVVLVSVSFDAGGKAPDPNVFFFNEKEVYSATRITIAPC
jgi:hypothetical protein